jgi:ornithine cyclodeaminase/alanine dehydrogenase-like protein (mu-crystallin family)
MLLLNNEEIERVLPVSACLKILEDAYRDLGNKAAATVPRYDVLTPNDRDCFYEYKTMSGVFPREKVAALRLNSSVVKWYAKGGNVRKDKLPVAAGDRFVGLVMLFSTETGEPLAIFPDGYVQKMRVASTAAIAARYLARRDATTMALLGSGWQASAHLLAICTVRDLKQVRVYSPTAENRRRFITDMQEKVDAQLVEAGSVSEALDGADLITCATNALSPLFPGTLLKPGVHVSCVKPCELDADTYRRAQPLVINWREAKPYHIVIGVDPSTIPDVAEGWRHPLTGEVTNFWEDLPVLSQLVNGEIPGKIDPSSITCFCNNIGIGLQFAAVGCEALRRAREAKVGRELPTDWFLESEHP